MKTAFIPFIWSLVLFNHCVFSCNPVNATSFSSAITNSPDRIISLPGYGCVDDIELAGSLPVKPVNNTSAPNPSLFYWFVESRHPAPDTPIVLWLNGGPGAASTYGFFMQNGPYQLSNKHTLIARTHSWTEHANYLIIDQPAGVGLSFGKKGTYRHEADVIDQLYQALQLFFTRFPELASRPFYIAGESYAGKYIPQLATRILADNNAKHGIHGIRLKGILIGDGWVNPRLQQSTNADFAYAHGLIDSNTHKKVSALYRQCANEIDKATPSSAHANEVCNKIQALIKEKSGNLSLVNIQTGKEPDDTMMIHYLNQPAVRKALHVEANAGEFRTFNQMASDILRVGEQDSVAELYTQLLEKHLPVLIYNGLDDGTDSNFMGTDKWLSALSWTGNDKFAKSSTCVWHVNKDVAGYTKTYAGLTQIKIRNAGHLAPADQPEILASLLAKFINTQPFCQASA